MPVLFLDFKRHCSGKLEDLGDTRSDDDVPHYSAALALDPASPQDLLIKRSKAYSAGIRLPKIHRRWEARDGMSSGRIDYMSNQVVAYSGLSIQAQHLCPLPTLAGSGHGLGRPIDSSI